MENVNSFTNLGVAGVALAILFFLVRYFVQAMTKKDDWIIEQTREFTKQTASFEVTIKNHISHSTKALNRLAKAVDKLAENDKKK